MIEKSGRNLWKSTRKEKLKRKRHLAVLLCCFGGITIPHHQPTNFVYSKMKKALSGGTAIILYILSLFTLLYVSTFTIRRLFSPAFSNKAIDMFCAAPIGPLDNAPLSPARSTDVFPHFVIGLLQLNMEVATLEVK